MEGPKAFFSLVLIAKMLFLDQVGLIFSLELNNLEMILMEYNAKS